jgi:hypothetical protein
MRLPKPVVRIANAVTMLALLVGIPRPPYTRDNALIIETVGRRSGKRRRESAYSANFSHLRRPRGRAYNRRVVEVVRCTSDRR